VLELLLCLLPSVAPEHTGEFGDIGIELRDNYDIDKLRAITEAASIRRAEISRKLSYGADKIEAAITALQAEGLIQTLRGGRIAIVG
jgi:hypothetical protein